MDPNDVVARAVLDDGHLAGQNDVEVVAAFTLVDEHLAATRAGRRLPRTSAICSSPAAGTRRRHPASRSAAASGRSMAASDIDLIDEAPAPVLARLKGSDDRMANPERVPAGMAHRRGIATADVPARKAQPQVQPREPSRRHSSQP